MSAVTGQRLDAAVMSNYTGVTRRTQCSQLWSD